MTASKKIPLLNFLEGIGVGMFSNGQEETAEYFAKKQDDSPILGGCRGQTLPADFAEAGSALLTREIPMQTRTKARMPAMPKA